MAKIEVRNSYRRQNLYRILAEDGRELDIDKFIYNLNKTRRDIKLHVNFELKGIKYQCDIYKTPAFIVLLNKDETFVIEEPEIDLMHPCASRALFELFLSKASRDYKFNRYNAAELNSDVIRVYKQKVMGMKLKYPNNFVATLKAYERKYLYRYFTNFCCNYDKRTAVEINRKDLVRFYMEPIMYGVNHNLYDVVAATYDINPWDIIKAPSKVYRDKKIRFDALEYIVKEYSIENIDDIKYTHINTIAPGLINYYRNYSRHPLDELKKEFTDLNRKLN